jgi:hypothetical protein
MNITTNLLVPYRGVKICFRPPEDHERKWPEHGFPGHARPPPVVPTYQ